MLVQLTMKSKSFTKLDREVSNEVNLQKGAALDASRTNKQLIDKDALKAIKKTQAQCKIYHDHMTLPYVDRGPRLLPTLKYLEYTEKMNGYINDIEIAKNDFLEHYNDYVEEQRVRLGEMFKANDYPDVSAIREAFGASITFYPLPDSSQLVKLAGVNKQDMAKIKKQVKQSLEEKTKEAMAEVWNRVYTAIKKLHGALTREKGKLHQSLVDTLVEFIELIPALNITGDKNLNKVVKQIQKDLVNYDMKVYKAAPDLKQDTADKAEKLMKQMEAYF
jgi:hypothetical protein